jgi:hypothetical protein
MKKIARSLSLASLTAAELRADGGTVYTATPPIVWIIEPDPVPWRPVGTPVVIVGH